MFDLERAVRGWRDDVAAERTLSRNHVDELEDHLRATWDGFVERGLEPARAWAAAREALGSPVEISAEYRKVENPTWRRLLVAGWAMFALAFQLPAYAWSFGVLGNPLGGGSLTGQDAFLLALGGDGGAVGVLSALTNVAVLATMWRLADRGRGFVTALAAAVVAAVGLNLWWITEVDAVSELQIGYWAWLASYLLVGGALTLRARALHEREEPAPEAG